VAFSRLSYIQAKRSYPKPYANAQENSCAIANANGIINTTNESMLSNIMTKL
jgi:hypothetical protein